MQGARRWRRWRCRAPENEPHDSPLSDEKIRHLSEAVRLSCTPPLCRLPSPNSFDSFDPFNFFNLDIFDFWQSSPENSATYGAAGLERALPLPAVRAKANVEDHHSRYSRSATVGAGRQADGAVGGGAKKRVPRGHGGPKGS